MTATAARPRVATLGILILDVLGHTIDELPVVQRSLLIDQIRITVAGTAGGTAVDLARLDLDVSVLGAVGDDTAGEFVRALLDREGIDTSAIVTKAGTATSASILPINSAGVRPAWHVRGANVELVEADVPRDVVADLDVLHYGGVSALPGLDGAACASLLSFAREHGVRTTADCLGVKSADALETFSRALPFVDVFMPNRDELAELTGCTDLDDAARAVLALGVGALVVKLDAEGARGFTADGSFDVPAYPADLVDSTGCGDAFCAGVIRGLAIGWDVQRAARLGSACGALTAQGLGSDAGIRDLASTMDFFEHGLG